MCNKFVKSTESWTPLFVYREGNAIRLIFLTPCSSLVKVWFMEKKWMNSLEPCQVALYSCTAPKKTISQFTLHILLIFPGLIHLQPTAWYTFSQQSDTLETVCMIHLQLSVWYTCSYQSVTLAAITQSDTLTAISLIHLQPSVKILAF